MPAGLPQDYRFMPCRSSRRCRQVRLSSTLFNPNPSAKQRHRPTALQMGVNWSSACAAAQARPLQAALDALYSSNVILLLAYALAAIAFAVRWAQWRRLSPDRCDAVWPLYGWFCGLAAAGNLFGFVAWLFVTLGRAAFFKGDIDPSRSTLQALRDQRDYVTCAPPPQQQASTPRRRFFLTPFNPAATTPSPSYSTLSSSSSSASQSS